MCDLAPTTETTACRSTNLPSSSYSSQADYNSSHTRTFSGTTPGHASCDTIWSVSSSSASDHSTNTDSDHSFSPSSFPQPHNKRKFAKQLAGWIHDDRATYDLRPKPCAKPNQPSRENSDSDRRSSLWRPTRPAPLPLLQHEPTQFKISLTESTKAYEIKVWLPSFSPDSITVSQHEDGSIHIVADQLLGTNTGHFERLCRLEHDQPHHAPSRIVSSSFDTATSVLIVRTLKRLATGRAVVCGNGSGLTGNKTYRLFF